MRQRAADVGQPAASAGSQASHPRSPLDIVLALGLDVPESAVSAALVKYGGNIDHAADSLLAAQPQQAEPSLSPLPSPRNSPNVHTDIVDVGQQQASIHKS